MKSIHTLVKGLHKAKLSRLLIVTTFLMIVSASIVVTYQRNTASHAELSYLEHSPKGAIGGSVMPASCDSYPAHSTCQCTVVGETSTVSCPRAYGTGSRTLTCVASGNDLILDNGPCVVSSCNAGYDKVTDWYGTYCKANCTGIQHRVMLTLSRQIGCNCWSTEVCSIYRANDSKTFASNDGLYISRTYAARTCIDPEFSYVPVAGCADCPAGTTPDANHVFCISSTPSVNINIGN